MPRAAENFEKMVLVRTKFLPNGQPPPQKFSPPLLGQAPLLEKNWPVPPLANFPKMASPPSSQGGETMSGQLSIASVQKSSKSDARF